MKQKEFKFKLGEKVKDALDGYSGIITCQCRNLTGCMQYVVLNQTPNQNKEINARYWVDEAHLVKGE